MGDEANAWVIAFVSSTCKMCHDLASEFKLLEQQESIKGRKAKFGYVDIDADES